MLQCPIASNVTVCLSIRKHIPGTTHVNFIKFSVQVVCGPVLLCLLFTSGLVVVIFCYCGPYGGVMLPQ